MEKTIKAKRIREIEYFEEGVDGANVDWDLDCTLFDSDLENEDDEDEILTNPTYCGQKLANKTKHETLNGYINNWKNERYTVEVELGDNAKMPNKAHPVEDAGFDLYTPTNVIIKPGEVKTIPLNFKISFSNKSYGQIAPKSGLASKGLQIMGGIIDSGYRGTVSVIVTNLNWGNDIISIQAGEKIAQLIMHPYSPDYSLKQVSKIKNNSERGNGGFNSTGNC